MKVIYIDILSDNDKEKYERLLKSDERSLLYASYEYKKLIENNIGAKSKYLLAKDQHSHILGTFPLMISPGGTYGPVINSLPYFGSNGGIIVDNKLSPPKIKKVKKALLERSLEILADYNCSAMVIVNSPFEDDVPFYEKYFPYHFEDQRIGQITHLPIFDDRYETNLIKKFQDPRPRNIRKAQKSGVECYYDHDIETLKILHELHHANITAIGGIPKSIEFFKSIPDYFTSNSYRVYIAHIDGLCIAALLLFYYNKTIEYFTPATDVSYRKCQPLSLLIFEAMKDGIEHGYRYWNWGGTWLSQKGVYDFKRRWGTTDYPYRYFIHLADKRLLEIPKKRILSEYPNFYVLPFNELND